jgi:hypothetical protein
LPHNTEVAGLSILLNGDYHFYNNIFVPPIRMKNKITDLQNMTTPEILTPSTAMRDASPITPTAPPPSPIIHGRRTAAGLFST